MINLTKNIENNLKKLKKINNEIKNKDHIIYLYIKTYLNAQRLGNSKTKERSEIKGSTRKILKQKGTGNARKGDIKNPIFRGGGRVFGPKKRDYKIKINKKIKLKLQKILIIKKILKNKVFFLKTFDLNILKTKNLLKYFNKLNLDVKNKKKKYLIITDKIYNNLLITSKNIKNIIINNKKNINYFNVLYSDYIIFIGKNIDKYIIKKIDK
ncbi:MAG: 50S ribosomal protein L4 [Candidatus Shikimatogenerans sp. JK-2022]|nr:50S ribosomal protein L4 [Candidatus Shikimatogenerans bostrichidophilus]